MAAATCTTFDGRVLVISRSSILSNGSPSEFLLASGSAARLRASSYNRVHSVELLFRIPRRAGVATGCQLVAWGTTPSAYPPSHTAGLNSD